MGGSKFIPLAIVQTTNETPHSSQRVVGLFPGVRSGRYVKLTTYFHPQLKFRINEVTPPLTLQVFMAYRRLILRSLSLATDPSASCFVTAEAMSLKGTVLLRPESEEELHM